MSKQSKTAGKTAERRAAGAAQATTAPAPTKGMRRFTCDNELIYRPTKWPFKIVDASGYIVQMECFTDRGATIDSGEIGGSYANSDDPGEVNVTDAATRASVFDSVEEAMAFINKRGDEFAVAEDGNVYPRVLKVRMSCVVEGVAFEPVIRDIEGGKKIEGVA